MAFFAIQTENNETVKKFIEQTNERTKMVTYLVGKMIICKEDEKNLRIIVNMRPLIFNIPMFLWPFIILMIVFNKINIFLFIASAFALTSLCWTPQFFRFITKKGLRKAGYKGKVTSINIEDILVDTYFKEV